MRSMHSVQRQVELRQLGNQLPVLGNANLLCKIVKMLCVLPLRLSPGCIGPRITTSRVIVARVKSVRVPVAPPGGVKKKKKTPAV